MLDAGFVAFSMAVTATLIVPALWACEPFRRIRIGVVRGNRIGHLAADIDLMVRRFQLDGWPRRTTHLFLAWHPANRHVLAMWKRHMPVLETWLPTRLVSASIPLFRRTRFHASLTFTNEEHREWSLGTPTLSFTSAEEDEGRDALHRMGIGDDDWFVCFQSRDPTYELTREGFGVPSLGRPSNRDCRIENYLPAARWIVEQGGHALRMGAAVDAPLGDEGPGIVDYAAGYRSEFLDVYLAARCRFFLGNSSGLFCVPLVFNVPVAVANYLPYACVGLGRTTLYTPKLLRRTSDGSLLTFPEIRDLGLMHGDIHEHRRNVDGTSFYADHGLEWVENDAEDVLGLCMDMMDRVEGRTPDAEVRELQDAYHALYAGSSHDTPYAGRIGLRFIRRHRHLLKCRG